MIAKSAPPKECLKNGGCTGVFCGIFDRQIQILKPEKGRLLGSLYEATAALTAADQRHYKEKSQCSL